MCENFNLEILLIDKQVRSELFVRMSRPWVLVCLLLLIVFTSQFEWKQQYGTELEASPNTSKKQQYISEREESVKEKVSTYIHIHVHLKLQG